MRHAILILLAITAVPCPAAADDDSGGSMGGGDWSSSDSGGGGDYSSNDSSSSYDSSSSSYDYSSNDSSTGGSASPAATLVLIVVAIGIAMFVGAARRSGLQSSYSGLSVGSFTPSNDLDVTVLRIALDGRSRGFVQQELARIAKAADTATADGRATMLREVALMLRRLRSAWVYGGAVNEPMSGLGEGRAVFERHVSDARGRFTHELVRNEQGVATTAPAPDHTPRSDEGAGLVLVSMIVAARSELFTVSRIGDGEQLRQALESVSNRGPRDLVAIEIVWQPANPDDRLSSVELEAKYPHPELIKVDGSVVGKVFCSYCGGPYPAELLTCPHCGGRAVSAAA